MYFSHSTDPLRYPTSPASDVGMGPPGVTTRLTSGYSSAVAPTAASTTPLFASAQTTWPSSLVAGSGVGSSTLDSILAGIKRSSESFYYPTVLGAHNMIGLSEAWYSTNSLTKRPRYESTSHLPIYPQRPGEKDCAYYMQTRTCKFGESCKFDHPIWVPEGGIPDWKEVPVITSDSFPVRPGEPDCPYFIKTQTCRFGSKCKFNHPRDKMITPDDSQIASVLPERPSEPPCAFYMKTGICKFGASCKFHHPKDLQIQLAGQANGSGEQTQSNIMNDGVTAGAQLVSHQASNVPASILNSKGLPIRLGEVDCPFYLKTGSCKYGATCRYNHPDRTAINPALAAIGAQILGSPADLSFGVVTPAASLYQTIDTRLSHSTVGALTSVYPQRPGQTECEYYMKTGTCMFGERCKFHHPVDRTALSTQGVTLTPAGLPRREGSIMCPYYLKTGTCKFGATCKFDHPPPAEVMTLSSLGTSTNPGEAKDGDEGA